MTLIKKKIVLTLAFLILLFSCYSQKLEDLIIEVDSVTNLVTKPIPFDRKFILKVRTDVKPPFVDYIKHKGNRSWNGTVAYYLDKDLSFAFESIPEDNYELRSDKGINYLFISFDKWPYRIDPEEKRNNLLSPSSIYSVIVPKFYENSIQIFENIAKGDTAKALILYNAYDSIQIEKTGFLYMLPKFDTIKTFAIRSNFISNFHKIDSIKNLQEISERDTSAIDQIFHNNLWHAAILSIAGIDTMRSIINKTYDLLAMLRTVQDISNAPLPVLRNIITGSLSLNNLTAEPKLKLAEKEKSANIALSISILKQMKGLFEILILQAKLNDPTNNLQYFERLIFQLTQQQNYLTGIIKEYNVVKNFLRNNKQSYFFEPSVVSGGTIIYDFKTRAKLQITPDFGYVVYGFQKGFTSFTPYVGFHINLRAVDKNIPFRNYPNKTIWHHLSVMTGWTLAGVAQQNKRENFFSSNSLLSGVGYKLSNAIRLNAGAMWFYKNDPNPLLDNRKIACTIYSGISIDLDIKEFLNDFTSLKPNLK
jgi:hypothetical protein